MSDTRIVKSILAVGALNILSGGGIPGDANREHILRDAVSLAERLFSLLFTDWVKVRSECSLERQFRLLADVIEADVKAMTERSPGRFSLTKPSDRTLVIARTSTVSGGHETDDRVIIEQSESGITVTDEGADALLFRVTSSRLSEDGECRLHVGERSCVLCQVSRKTLENLFFPAQEK
jgi:hypothetical protein